MPLPLGKLSSRAVKVNIITAHASWKTLLTGIIALSFASASMAQNSDFSVAVGTGPDPLGSATVYPGEATSFRIIFDNNSLTTPLTNVSFSKALPTNALNGLLVNGTVALATVVGCTGAVVTASVGSAEVSLTGLTVPPRQTGVQGSGQCYLDIPIAAYSIDGNSTSLAYSIDATEATSNEGENFSGAGQAITIRETAAPTWSKSFVSNSRLVIGGETRTLRFTLNNPDRNVDLTGVEFSDIFPTNGAGAVMETTGVVSVNTCGATINLIAGAGSRVDVSSASVATESSCTIDVEVRALQNGGVYQLQTQNSVLASSFISDQGLRPSDDANRDVRIRSPLSVTKSFAPAVVASGEANTFTITLSNNGSVALPIIDFVDNPISASPNEGQLSIASVVDISNSCAGSSPVLLGGGEGFSDSGFVIPPFGSCNVVVIYTGVTPGADAPTTYTNVLPENAVKTSVAGIISQQQSASVLVADRLRVLKSQVPASASPGDPVRYSITVENYSTGVINDVTITDALQNGSTLLLGGSFDPSLTAACGLLGLNGAAQGDSSITFSVPTLPARVGTNTPGRCVVSFSAMIDPNATTQTSNEIPAGAVCFGSGSPICNSIGSGSVDNANLQSLLIRKTFNGGENVSQSEGTPVRLRLEFENNSISPLTSLTLNDPLPFVSAIQQLRVSTPPNINNGCGGTVIAAAGSNSVVLNSAIVPPFDGSNPGTCALEIDVVGPAGTYVNTAFAEAVRQNANGSTSSLNADDEATLTHTAALQVEKSFFPTTAGPGGTSTATIRLTSLDPDRPITSINITDDLPAGMQIANPDNAFSTCSGGPSLSAASGALSASLSGATLAPLAVCELRFDVEVTTSGSDWVNILPVGAVTADGELTNLTQVDATLTFVAPGVPLISKTLNPGSIVPGQSSVLTINIDNAPQDLSNVELADYFTADGLPGSAVNGMRVASTPAASTTCTDGIVSASPDGTSVRLSGATMLASSQCQIEVRVTSVSAGTTSNLIPVNSLSSNQGATNSTSFAQSALSTSNVVGVSKSFAPTVMSPGQVSRLSITLFNGADGSVTDMSLTDDFPVGLVVAAPANLFSNCGGGVSVSNPTPASIMITGGSLGPVQGGQASSCVVEADVTSLTEGTYLNIIPADSLASNGTPLSHPATDATIEVRDRVMVNKAIDNKTLDGGDPVGFDTDFAARLPGESALLTIRIENPTTRILTLVSIIDRLPDGLVLAQVPALISTCADASLVGVAAGREIRMTGATLAATGDAAAICTITADVVSNIPGIYTNEIPVGALSSLEGIGNDPVTQAQIIVSTPPGISKDIVPPVIAPNGTAVLTIVIENNNDLDMTLSADLVDTLPASPGQMLVATPSIVDTNCVGGAAIVTAAAGSSAVTIASGSIIQAGGCWVSAQVTAVTEGDYLNFIPVGALDTNFGLNDRPAQAPLKVSTLGYITGRVFLDGQTVPDGTYLPGVSTPLSDISIELHDGADCSAPLTETSVTDSNGSYQFSELLAGTYSVCQLTQPPSSLNGVTQAGVIEIIAGSTGTPGVASNPIGGVPISQIIGIVLNNNGNADQVSGTSENNFSEVLPVSIAGNVYYDADNNGVFDMGETGIGGVAIELSGSVNASAMTSGDGSYRFADLPPGDYVVVEAPPGIYSDGQDTVGEVAGVARGSAVINDQFSAIALAPGEDGINYNFGETLPAMVSSAIADVFCANNAVRVNYELPAFAGNPGTAPNVTISWITLGGRLVEQLFNQGTSGVLVWPGTVLDPGGEGVGWPGWEFVAGEWIEVPDDRIPQMVLRITLNGDSELNLDYPASRSSCLTQPPGTFAPARVSTLNGLAGLLAALLGVIGLWQVRVRENALKQ
jgi:uncharacterized repeat protein (TIGR01451 family)